MRLNLRTLLVAFFFCELVHSCAAADSFCDSDPRIEVKVFCHDLKQLQDDVNSDQQAGKKSDLTGDLNQLDLANRHSTVKDITAMSTTAAADTNIATKSLTGLPGNIVQSPDQQTSAGNGVSGTTSLISKAGSAALLSLALDSGALTQSVNGTTSTLTTNGDQLFRAITRNQPDCILNCGKEGWFEQNVLNQINISATLSLAQQSSTTTPTSGQAAGTTPTPVNSVAIPTGAGKLSAITVKYQQLNKFDPRSQSFKTAWNDAIKKSAALATAVKSLGDATDPVATALTAGATPLDRQAIYDAAASDKSGRALSNYFSTYFNAVAASVLKNKDLIAAIAKVMQSRSVYRDAWYAVLDDAVGTLISFQYSYNKPVSQPDTHDLTIIGGYNFKTMGMLTFNGAVSMYGGSLPAGASYGRVHFGQVSAEYDQTLNKNGQLQGQLSLAGYWQYQPNPSILNIPAGTVVPGTTIPLPNGTQEFVGTAGSLWVTQAKITVKGAGGVNVPIGVSWSNKTDLLRGSKVGAQIGISYNFSSLGQLF